MKAGQGDPRLPARDDEELADYLVRLEAAKLEPLDTPSSDWMLPPPELRLPYRDHDDEPAPRKRSSSGPWEER